jgi:CheY-like chemotaxis protein/anti-sigma regulatory factor (Ser/Thr protein kinase)
MPRILVVDDLLADRRLAGGLLSKDESIEVYYASDGVDALDKIEEHMPDLVITDLQMPEMNGLELVQRVREEHPLIPTILMTAKGSEEFAVQALEKGAASYVPKKHLAADLLETVRRVLATSTEDRSFTRLMNRLSEIRFVLENDLSMLSALVSHLRHHVQHRRICNDADSIRVATSLDEALLNAYYHGNLEVDSALKNESHEKFHELAKSRLREQPYSERRITVIARYSPVEAVFVIRDEGPGFNSSVLPDPTDPEFLEKPSGRGLLLMRSFMDEVTFNDSGNEVTLVKRKEEHVAISCEDHE